MSMVNISEYYKNYLYLFLEFCETNGLFTNELLVSKNRMSH